MHWHTLGYGVLMGSACGSLLLFEGQIAGVSTALSDLLRRKDLARRTAFLAGLVSGGAFLAARAPLALPSDYAVPLPAILIAGLLVGAGARIGNGCTSGHSVCGVGRLSPRSLMATLLFGIFGATGLVLSRLAGWASY